jgi:putative transposase
VRIANVGQVKIRLHRPWEGLPKTATITRSSTGQWSVCFSCECAEPSPLPQTGQRVGIDVGIDVGLKTFATLATGEEVAHPRFFRGEEKALATVQHRLSKAEKGTPERARRRKMVARAHERTRWRRGDFTHQRSRRIVNTFDLIALEDVSVKRMVHNHCRAKRIHDVAWSQFASLLSYKAAWAGRK